MGRNGKMTDSDSADSNQTMSPVKESTAVVSEDLPLSIPRSNAIDVPTTVNGNLLGLEHFPPAFEAPLDSRRCSSRSSRFGRLSPTHSAHGCLLRHTLLQVSQEKRAKKVRFYRNGDRFFKGMVYAVSPERFRTFESLLADLTTSPVCDNKVLPNGVRYLFTLDGMKKMTNLDQLEEGQSYVCASTDAFKRIDYSKNSNPGWNPNSRSQPEGALTAREAGSEDPDEKSFVRPKLVTVIRNGSKPRKAVRILLNRKTAHSFDQVMTDITSAIKLDTGAVRRLYTLDGRPIQGLPDFFKEDSVFIAYGPEKQALDDFDLDDREVRFVSAYQSVRDRKRITLKSPKLPRKPSNFSVRSRNGFSPAGSPGSPTPQRYTFSSSPAGSPSLQRKMEIL